MDTTHPLRKKLVQFLFCSFVILVVLALTSREPQDKDDTFWQSFLSYFQVSQPKQVVTQEAYQKPPEGISVEVPVIVYHGVRPNYEGETALVKRYTTEPDTLDKELQYLKENNYHTISLDDIANYFEKGVPLPPKPIVLTFDDGWENQYVYAFPLLIKYGFTGTFFIFTNAMGHKNFLTWDQIKEMNAAGMTIGGHTKTHPYLTKITDPILLDKEVAGGKKIIEEHIGHSIDTFAYPFGFYNASTTEAVQNAGYRIARTSRAGLWHTEKSLLTLGAIYDQNSPTLFSKFVATTNEISNLTDERPVN